MGARALTAIGLDFCTLTFWKSRGFPLKPQKVKLFAGGVNSNQGALFNTGCVLLLTDALAAFQEVVFPGRLGILRFSTSRLRGERALSPI